MPNIWNKFATSHGPTNVNAKSFRFSKNWFKWNLSIIWSWFMAAEGNTNGVQQRRCDDMFYHYKRLVPAQRLPNTTAQRNGMRCITMRAWLEWSSNGDVIICWNTRLREKNKINEWHSNKHNDPIVETTIHEKWPHSWECSIPAANTLWCGCSAEELNRLCVLQHKNNPNKNSFFHFFFYYRSIHLLDVNKSATVQRTTHIWTTLIHDILTFVYLLFVKSPFCLLFVSWPYVCSHMTMP